MNALLLRIISVAAVSALPTARADDLPNYRALAVSAIESSPDKVLLTYKHCMLESIAHYAAKTDNASEAIDAGKSRCKEQREVMWGYAFGWVFGDYLKRTGSPPPDEKINESTNAALQDIDESIRPDLVRRFLDVK